MPEGRQLLEAVPRSLLAKASACRAALEPSERPRFDAAIEAFCRLFVSLRDSGAVLGAPEVSWIDRQLSELLGCVCAVAKSGSAEGRRVLDEMPERLATLTARFAARELKAGESVAPLAVLAEVQRELEEAIRSAQR